MKLKRKETSTWIALIAAFGFMGCDRGDVDTGETSEATRAVDPWRVIDSHCAWASGVSKNLEATRATMQAIKSGTIEENEFASTRTGSKVHPACVKLRSELLFTQSPELSLNQEFASLARRVDTLTERHFLGPRRCAEGSEGGARPQDRSKCRSEELPGYRLLQATARSIDLLSTHLDRACAGGRRQLTAADSALEIFERLEESGVVERIREYCEAYRVLNIHDLLAGRRDSRAVSENGDKLTLFLDSELPSDLEGSEGGGVAAL